MIFDSFFVYTSVYGMVYGYFAIPRLFCWGGSTLDCEFTPAVGLFAEDGGNFNSYKIV